jgi:hypothetical protein
VQWALHPSFLQGIDRGRDRRRGAALAPRDVLRREPPLAAARADIAVAYRVAGERRVGIVTVQEHVFRMRLRCHVGLGVERQRRQAFLLPRPIDQRKGVAPELLEIAGAGGRRQGGREQGGQQHRDRGGRQQASPARSLLRGALSLSQCSALRTGPYVIAGQDHTGSALSVCLRAAMRVKPLAVGASQGWRGMSSMDGRGDGGRDKVRTCDPHDVNVVLYR